MIAMPSNEQSTETAADPQDAETVASIKLDDVTGGWWGPGAYAAPYAAPWGGPYGAYASPYAAARFAAYERRASWYAAGAPRVAPWWGY
jgi:hypothetical protein